MKETGEEPAWSSDGEPPKRKKSKAVWWIVLLALIPVGVVCAGLLAAVFVPLLKLREAQTSLAQGDLQSLRTLLEIQATENAGVYPSTLDELSVADFEDPWRRPYVYEVGPEHRWYRLYTLGQDGVPGGRGEDSDRYAVQKGPVAILLEHEPAIGIPMYSVWGRRTSDLDQLERWLPEVLFAAGPYGLSLVRAAEVSEDEFARLFERASAAGFQEVAIETRAR